MTDNQNDGEVYQHIYRLIGRHGLKVAQNAYREVYRRTYNDKKIDEEIEQILLRRSRRPPAIVDVPAPLLLALMLHDGDKEPEGPPKLDTPLTLAGARELAGAALRKVEKSIEPSAEKRQAKAAKEKSEANRTADSVEEIAKRFLKLHVEKKNRASTHAQVKRIFDVEVLPVWRRRTVHDITKRDVVTLLGNMAEDRPTLANRTLAVIRKFFNWQIAQDIIKTLSPCAGVEPPSKEKSRNRVLSDDEIKNLWNACEDIGQPFEPFVKLLLLTGQRRTEVSDMRWSEIDEEKNIWTLPPERTKNGREHVVPLSPQAWAIIEAQPKIKDSDFVLTTTGESGVSGFSHAKITIDKQMNPNGNWTYHDVRRSVVTHMADDLAVLPHVIEAVVNHISGHKAGVAGVYNRATYAAEKRDALDRWADRIDEIFAGKSAPAKIIKFKKRAGKRK